MVMGTLTCIRFWFGNPELPGDGVFLTKGTVLDVTVKRGVGLDVSVPNSVVLYLRSFYSPMRRVLEWFPFFPEGVQSITSSIQCRYIIMND